MAVKNFLAKVFAVWAMLIFVISLLIFFPFILLSGLWAEPRRSHYLQPIFQAWMKVFFTLAGVRRTFTGKQNFKKGETYIIVCNHRSLLDPPLSSPGIPYANKTIAKIEMSRIPLFGLIYKRGSVLVDRKNEESRKSSYGKMKDVLALGLHMCIYPEGTRNRTHEPLQKFHDGAFKLAVETKTPLMPAIITGTAKVMPANKGFYFWPHPVSMNFLKPISSEGKTVSELKEETFEVMRSYIEKINKN